MKFISISFEFREINDINKFIIFQSHIIKKKLYFQFKLIDETFDNETMNNIRINENRYSNVIHVYIKTKSRFRFSLITFIQTN